jgi:hypothetical protein
MPIGVQLFALGRMTVTSTGTGASITLNAAVPGFLTFDLSGCSTASAGQVVGYAINDISNSESGVGTYYSSSITLTRGSSTDGLKSTNSNSRIDMTNAAQVVITPTSYTFKGPTVTLLTTASNGGTGAGNYNPPANVSWVRVRMVGGGSGGSAAGSTNYTAGSTGGATYFGSTSYLYCDGGHVGLPTSGGGFNYATGGSATNGSGLTGIVLKGADGGGGSVATAAAGSTTSVTPGAAGGSSPFGGAGRGGYASEFAIIISTSPTDPAVPNSGSGGGSAAAQYATPSVYFGYVGPSGAAGGYIDINIPSSVLASTYAYSIGRGGTGGISVSSTLSNQNVNGGAGGSGQIFIEEHYS